MSLPRDQHSGLSTRRPTPGAQRLVKAANRQLYDAMAEQYEQIDGRRSPTMEVWLRGRLVALRQRSPGGRLLDVGTGSGLVTRCAEGLFSPRVGMDLSPRILALHRGAFEWGLAGDVDHLPFSDGSFDAVTCFAVLHHLHNVEGLVSEVARVLAPGGVLYTDHDMDSTFGQRFRLPLALYRKLQNAQGRYLQSSAEITREMYEMAEWQADGVDAADLVRCCAKSGLVTEVGFHWFGLNPLADRLFGRRSWPAGWAPLLSMVAVKSEES